MDLYYISSSVSFETDDLGISKNVPKWKRKSNNGQEIVLDSKTLSDEKKWTDGSPYVENFEAQSKTLDYWKNNGKVKSFTVNGKTTTYYTPDTDGIKKDMITSIEDGFNSVFSFTGF